MRSALAAGFWRLEGDTRISYFNCFAHLPCDAAGQKVQKVEAETAAGDDLRAEYQRRHDERQEARERWSRLEQHVADARLVVFSAGLMLAFFVSPNALAECSLAGRTAGAVRRSCRGARAAAPAEWPGW